MRWALLAASLLACLPITARAADAPTQSDQLQRGAYLFAAAGCANCHTDRVHRGAALAGGRAIVTRFGTFVTPNISSDPKMGIGGWSDADFLNALRHGLSPQGKPYYPAFPYPAYTLMTDRDLLAIKAYLMTQPPQPAADHPHRLRFPYSQRSLLLPWRMLFFREGPFQPDPDQSDEWNRGAYLARAVGHCGQCHTPTNFLGAPEDRLRYAGVANGPDGMKAPDITPDAKALGPWSIDDIAEFLKDGSKPDGDFAGGAMAEVIRGTSVLSAADRRAIAVYLKSVPAVAPVK